MKPLILLSLLTAPLLCFSQKNELGTIKGTVRTADGQPAESVSVLIKNINAGAITDESGKFEFRKVKPGNYTLSFSLSNYAPKQTSVTIKANGQNILSVQLEQTYAELQKVIVQARVEKYAQMQLSPSLRLSAPLIEIPQNIQITSRQLLADQGSVSMSEAIRTVSGIQKNYGELNDITLNFRGGEGSFNILRNGLGAYWWNQQEDIAMVEKIEFIKGPAGFIANNFPGGGFVNVVTKQPQREQVASVKTEYGSFDLFRLSTDWGGPFSKKSKFTYRINAGLHKQNRAFQFSNGSRYFASGALKCEPDKKNTITTEYNYMWGKTSGNNFDVPSLNGRMFALPRNFAIADAKTDNIIVADNYFRLLATHRFNDNWNLNLLLGNMYGKWGQDYNLDADGDIPVTNDTLYRYAEFDDWRNYSRVAQLYLNGKFCTGKQIQHTISAAIDYTISQVTDAWGATDSKFGLYIPAPNYYVNPDSLRNFPIDNSDTFHSKNPSLYLADHIKIIRNLILTLAGRFSHEKVKFVAPDIPTYQQNISIDHITPRVGLTYLFSEQQSAYAIYDEFFLPIYARTFDNRPLKPLAGYNAEVGLKGSFKNGNLAMGLSAYHIVVNNSLEKDPYHQDCYIQTGQIVHDGIDFDLTGNITPSFMLNANYAYAHAWISKGDSAMIGRKKIGTPDHSANVWLKYKLLRGKFKGISFALGYQYMGHRSALYLEDPGGNVYLPVYNLFDAAINYHHERFTVGLNVYNITNRDYATYGTFKPSTSEWRYAPGEPINFRLSLGINLVFLKKPNKQTNSPSPQ